MQLNVDGQTITVPLNNDLIQMFKESGTFETVGNISQSVTYNLYKKACEEGELDFVKTLDNDPFFNKFFIDPTSWDIRKQAFLNACYYGHVSIVEYFTQKPYFSTLDLEYDSVLNKIVDKQQLHVFEYLITHPLFKNVLNEQTNLNMFLSACRKGNQKILQYFVSNGFLDSQKNNKFIPRAFSEVALSGDVKSMEYLLTDSFFTSHFSDSSFYYFKKISSFFLFKDDLKEINISDCIHKAIKYSCSSNSLPLVKYLLELPQLKKITSKNNWVDDSFDIAFAYKNTEVIHYLITECFIPLTKKIKKLIKDDSDIQKLFSSRNLYVSLHHHLEKKDTSVALRRQKL